MTMHCVMAGAHLHTSDRSQLITSKKRARRAARIERARRAARIERARAEASGARSLPRCLYPSCCVAAAATAATAEASLPCNADGRGASEPPTA